MKATFASTFFIGISLCTNANGRELTVAEKAMVAKTVSAAFFDPNAAQFRWTPLTDGLNLGNKADGGTQFYCAMVNGKNRLGGYVGFEPFIAMVFSKNDAVIYSALVGVGTANEGSDEAVYKICAGHGLDPRIGALVLR